MRLGSLCLSQYKKIRAKREPAFTLSAALSPTVNLMQLFVPSSLICFVSPHAVLIRIHPVFSYPHFYFKCE